MLLRYSKLKILRYQNEMNDEMSNAISNTIISRHVKEQFVPRHKRLA